MNRKHLYAFYSTLLVPCGAVAGYGVGQVAGFSTWPMIVGSILGFAAAYALVRGTAPGERP
jgi:F0F1-type ATP synthase assembly protein I